MNPAPYALHDVHVLNERVSAQRQQCVKGATFAEFLLFNDGKTSDIGH